jgi:hypothetical protein
VTSLHFTPDSHLVSAGRDNVLKVWRLGEREAVLTGLHAGRTGDATSLGVSPDGRRLLFDHGEELRILDRQSGDCVGSLRGTRQGRFHGFAAFAPSGKAVLTAANTGRVQLWSVPAEPRQARFFRHAYVEGFGRNSLGSLQAIGGAQTPTGLVPGWLPVALPGPRQPAPPRATAPSPVPQMWVVDGYEVRYFLSQNPAAVTCGAFAPDEAVIFTGGDGPRGAGLGPPPGREVAAAAGSGNHLRGQPGGAGRRHGARPGEIGEPGGPAPPPAAGHLCQPPAVSRNGPW